MNAMRLAALVMGVSLFASRGLKAQAPDGQAIYREECRSCHGAAGKPTQRAVGQYKNMPTLDSTFLSTRSIDSIVTVLNHGKGKDMKSFKDKLSADEIAAVAKYVKQTFGGTAATSH